MLKKQKTSCLNLGLIILFYLSCTLVGIKSFAAENQQEVGKIAKKRMYLGGRDEADLKVQAQLPVVVRKLNPTQEEAPESDNQSND